MQHLLSVYRLGRRISGHDSLRAQLLCEVWHQCRWGVGLPQIWTGKPERELVLQIVLWRVVQTRQLLTVQCQKVQGGKLKDNCDLCGKLLRTYCSLCQHLCVLLQVQESRGRTVWRGGGQQTICGRHDQRLCQILCGVRLLQERPKNLLK